MPDTTAPVVTVGLANRTGPTATSDATLSGTVVDATGVAQVLARVTLAGGTASAWVDVTAAVQDAVLTVNSGVLAGLMDGVLPDGQYLVEFQAEDLFGNISTPQALAFQLDTVAPVVDFTELYDGIAWDGNQQLTGTISDGSGSGAQGTVDYQIFQDAMLKGSSSVALTGGGSGGSGAGGFNGVITGLKDLVPGVYRLEVTGQNGADNRQTQSLQFLIADPDPKDDERLPDQPTADPTPPSTPINGNPATQWGYVGPGGVWGTGSSGGGGGSGSGGGSGGYNWTPSTGPGIGNLEQLLTVIGDGYDQDYMTGLGQVLHHAEAALSTAGEVGSKKTALEKRIALLLDLGQRVAGGGFYDRMALVFEGVFKDAYDPSNNSVSIPPEKVGTYDAQYYEAKSGISAGQALKEGLELAVDLAQDSLAVKTQVFQAALLTLVNAAFNTKLAALPKAEYDSMAQALLELGRVYARLSPTKDPADAATSTNWLDMLWQAAQTGSAAELYRVETLLSSQFGQLANPTQGLLFVARLVTAAGNIVETRNDMKSAAFIAKLVKFGVEIARVNPTVTAGANDYSDWIESLIEGNATLATTGLSTFFAGLDSLQERTIAMQKAVNLLAAAQALPNSAFANLKQDAKFLSNLANFSSAYAAVDPNHSIQPTLSSDPDSQWDFFLDSNWNNKTQEQVAQELTKFLQDAKLSIEPAQLLKQQQKLLSTLKLVSALKEDLSNPAFFRSVVSAMNLHFNLLASAPDQDSEINGGIYADVCSAVSQQDLRTAAKNLEKFLTASSANFSGTIAPQLFQNSTTLIAQGGSTSLINPSYEPYLSRISHHSFSLRKGNSIE